MSGTTRWLLRATAVTCWALTAALAVLYHGQTRPSGLDRAVGDALRAGLRGHGTLLAAMGLTTNPAVVLAAIAVIVLVAALRNRWRLAALAVAGPVVTVLLTDLLAKPLVGRRYDGGHLCYPSGHTGGVVAVLTVLLVAAWSGRSALLRLLAATAWLVLGAATATGLVAMNYHYPTDTLGGAGLAVGTVLMLHLALDHRRRRRQRDAAGASPSQVSAT